MPRKRVQVDKKAKTERAVRSFILSLKDCRNIIQQAIIASRIVILGEPESTVKKIRDKLIDLGHPAFIIRDDFSKRFPDLPEFELEKIAIKEADIIIMIDSGKPGVAQESTMIMSDEIYQLKTILLVDGKKKFDELTDVKKQHYVYYPTIYGYSNNNDLIQRSVKLAVKAAYRLAYLGLNYNPKQ